jgi:hypothetical protein
LATARAENATEKRHLCLPRGRICALYTSLLCYSSDLVCGITCFLPRILELGVQIECVEPVDYEFMTVPWLTIDKNRYLNP